MGRKMRGASEIVNNRARLVDAHNAGPGGPFIDVLLPLLGALVLNGFDVCSSIRDKSGDSWMSVVGAVNRPVALASSEQMCCFRRKRAQPRSARLSWLFQCQKLLGRVGESQRASLKGACVQDTEVAHVRRRSRPCDA